MRIRRLGWAGVEIENDGTSVAIDPLGTLGFFEEFWGAPEDRDELVALEPDSIDAVLLTHLHRDHTDPEAVASAVVRGGAVAGPRRTRFESDLQKFAIGQQEDALAALGVRRSFVEPGDSLQTGGLTATACESVDGVGASQVAWLVSDGESSVLHCGDTIWHGHWWDIASEHGSPDLVCLPANGVEVAFPFHVPPVAQLADMTPEQAVDAAYVLGAGALMPIHFSLTYDHDQMYRPVRDAEARLRAAASERGVELLFPAIGEWIEVRAAAPSAV